MTAVRWMAVLAAALLTTGCASTGESSTAATGAATTTFPGTFDRLAAGEALRRGYPNATSDALAAALEIASEACIVPGYENTAEGGSAIFAIRRTEGGLDIITMALDAGCEDQSNAVKFVTEVRSGS